MQEALNATIAAGKPIGGTSARLAVLGEFVYGALEDTADGPDLASTAVLPNPYYQWDDADSGLPDSSATRKINHRFAFREARPLGPNSRFPRAYHAGRLV